MTRVSLTSVAACADVPVGSSTGRHGARWDAPDCGNSAFLQRSLWKDIRTKRSPLFREQKITAGLIRGILTA